MYVIDKASHDGSDLRVLGWCFKSGFQIKKVIAEIGDDRSEIQGYGLESEDVAQHYGNDARDARFDFRINTPSRLCTLEFQFNDGTVSRARIDLTGNLDKLTAFEHRIRNGVYTGRFGLAVREPIQSVHFLPNTDAPQDCSAPIVYSESGTGQERVIEIDVSVPGDWDTQCLGILVKTTEETISLSSIANTVRSRDQSHQICARFFEALCQSPIPLKVVEIGSRARSGIVRKHQFGEHNEYVGFDILEGPNVDVVGDIHSLSKSLSSNSVDAIAGFSVFEHVAMPWKAAIEMNKVLKLGGQCMFHTHQAWPLHESPYDFWRFSTDSWRALFNRFSGFRIVDSACGGEATIHPLIQAKRVDPLESALAYTSSSVLVEKISETQLSWEVDLDEIHSGEYPV